MHLVRREPALGKDIQHFAADIARRADDGNLVTHGAHAQWWAGH
jgi:hypothetical protein